MLRQIVLDTETTGLSAQDGHRIIEIGCIELVNRYRTGNDFHYYINPERDIDPEAVAVHGITAEFLQDKSVFRDIAESLLDYLKGAELIIHNAVFDLSFLDKEFSLLNRRIKPLETYCNIFDTLLFARKKHVAQRNNLDALCKRYAVDNSSRKLHGALRDASLLADVFLAMTRGQAELFQDDTDTVEGSASSWQAVPPTTSSQTADTITTHRLFVQKASPEEVALHEAFFEDAS